MKNNSCVNAYLNLNVRTTGSVTPCCMSNRKFVSDNGATTIDKDSVLNFWNSKSRKAFIEEINSGVRVPECSACWSEEDAGKDSKRIRDNKTFADTELTEDMLPLVLDISMGNLCNLKCRICSPYCSTPTLAEDNKIESQIGYRKIFINDAEALKNSYNYDNDYFWKDIIKLLPNVVKYDFAGGEPFYIEKHWDIVKTAVENGWSKKQHIHYNTNGTIFPKKYIELLNEFKIVDIQISSDGVGKKFEYMRHPAKWDVVEENIERFLEEKRNSKTEWMISTCISISAFNVYDFFETFEHYAAKGIGSYINVVHDHRGTKVLPPVIKKQIIEKLMKFESAHRPQEWIRERDMICKHLTNTNFVEYDWTKFVRELKIRDEFRKESFADTFPEYYELIRNSNVEW